MSTRSTQKTVDDFADFLGADARLAGHLIRACRRLDRDYWGDLLSYVVDLDNAAFMAAALAADYLGTPWLPEARFLSAPEPELEAVLLAALRAAWEPGK